MLQFIRDRAQGWIAIAIIGILIIALASFAWDAYFGPDPDVAVASVNGEKITANEFQREYQQQRARLQAMLGGTDISRVIPDEAQFKSNILKKMEEEELIYQMAKESGFRVSDGLLAQQIRSFEAFQTNGQFDSSLYQQWLQQNRFSSAEFEDILRRDVLVQQYRMGVAATAWVSGRERQEILRKQEQQRDVGMVRIPAAAYMADIAVSDADALAQYEGDKQRYASQEQVNIQYLELSLDALMGAVQVNEDALQEMYKDHQADFAAAAERHVRHILIEASGDGGQQVVALDKAQSLVKQLRAGADFGKLAAEHSDDIGSANSGGDLGFLSRDDMMDPAFADAAFALKSGEVSEPVKSSYGYHIIKLEGVKAGETRPFAEVRAQLEQDYRHKQAEEIFFEQSELLSNLTFENPDSLEPAARALGLQVNMTPYFTRDNGIGLAANPEVRKLAFSDEVLLQGNNSEVKEIGSNHLVVLRIKDHQESAVRPFAEVQGMIVNQIKQERARAQAKQRGEELIQALQGGGDVAQLVKEKGLAWQHIGLVKRNDGSVEHDVISKAFRMRPSAEGGKGFGGIVLPSGDYVVVALLGIHDVAADALSGEQQRGVASVRERYYGISQLLGAVNNLRSVAEIKEYPENF